MQTPVVNTYKFAAFEVNPASGELLKNGRRVKLQDQPFRLLIILLENAGQVVNREEIQRRIWPGNTFVDFDSGLRVAVRKLRNALGDDADNPVYLETVPKRGYRFIVPPTRVERGQQAADTNGRLPVAKTDVARQQIIGLAHGKNTWIIPAALVLTVAAAAMFLFFVHGPRKLTGADTVVLADFANSTGDPVFDETLRQGLAVQLEQSPFLSLISDQRIQQTLRLMGQTPDARLTPELAADLCNRTQSAAVINGSIASLGTQYVLGLKAVSCRTGEILDEQQVQVIRKEDVLNALSRMASNFRSRAGESLSTIAKHDTPLEEATTPSLEALKAYSDARNFKYASVGYGAQVPLVRRAIEIDPNFAMAYAFLGRLYGDIGESVLSAEAARKAFQLRDHASERERFFIDVTYDRQVTGDLEKAHQTLESWALAYPRDVDAHGLLSGFSSQGQGKYQQAIEEGLKAIAVDPDFVPAYANVAFANLYQDRLSEAEDILKQAAGRKLEVPDYISLRYYIALLKGDTAGMAREAALGEKNPGEEDWMLHSEALTEARSGRLVTARTLSSRAVNLAEQAGQRETAAVFETGAAVWDALLGNAPAAKKKAAQALELSKGRDVEYGAALAYAFSGDSIHAQALANELENRWPEDTSVKFSYIPTVRALIALNHGESAHAIDLLQAAASYELAVPGIDYYFFFGGLYSAYVRGLAYSAMHRNAEAAVEFQKILDHRGLVAADPVGALAHLQLGRTYAMAGDKANARAAYQDFLTLWKDADPGVPLLKQARVEFAKLN